jgi:DNA polymerase elongation subunit (family B)
MKTQNLLHPLKIHFTDIETFSPAGVPDPHDPQDPINVITVYDTLAKKFYTWGTSKYTGENPNDLIFIYCNDEKELLQKYLDFFIKDRPDILSGWNSTGFDVPYIINRLKKVLGEDATNTLSPINRLRTREFTGKFGKPQIQWYIEGISCIDYLDIYRRFCPVLRESYKLGNIGELELGESKVDFGDTDLATLATENWNIFVDYNIQDVRLLIKLEEKLQYIALLRMIAYFGLTTFEGALGSVGVFIGLCACEARKRKQCIPTFARTIEDDTQNIGAYVAEPKRGFQECIVTYDANSLYPNTMISLNLSPETKIGRIIENTDKEVVVQHVNGQEFRLSPESFLEFIKKENIAVSKARILFSQNEKGIIPAFLDRIYQQRLDIKEKLKKLKKQLSRIKKDLNNEKLKKVENEIDRLDILQYTIKIVLNFVYGCTGNRYNPMGDDELAESVTLTGQAVIKESNIVPAIRNKACY